MTFSIVCNCNIIVQLIHKLHVFVNNNVVFFSVCVYVNNFGKCQSLYFPLNLVIRQISLILLMNNINRSIQCSRNVYNWCANWHIYKRIVKYIDQQCVCNKLELLLLLNPCWNYKHTSWLLYFNTFKTFVNCETTILFLKSSNYFVNNEAVKRKYSR